MPRTPEKSTPERKRSRDSEGSTTRKKRPRGAAKKIPGKKRQQNPEKSTLEQKRPMLVVIGRSNVGKSSICRLLAPWLHEKIKVGKFPGVTTHPIHLDVGVYEIVDLPGFGFMKGASRTEMKAVQETIIKFIEENHDLIFLALEVIGLPTFRLAFDKHAEDSVPFDAELLQFLCEFHVPTVILANKIDKLYKNELDEEFEYMKQALEIESVGATAMQFSAKKETGLPELTEIIKESFAKYKEGA